MLRRSGISRFNCWVETASSDHFIRRPCLGLREFTAVKIKPLGLDILIGSIKSILTFSWPLGWLIIWVLLQVVLNFLIRFLYLLSEELLDLHLMLFYASLKRVFDRSEGSHLPCFSPGDSERSAICILIRWHQILLQSYLLYRWWRAQQLLLFLHIVLMMHTLAHRRSFYVWLLLVNLFDREWDHAATDLYCLCLVYLQLNVLASLHQRPELREIVFNKELVCAWVEFDDCMAPTHRDVTHP